MQFGGPFGASAMFAYLLAHALLKAGLFCAVRIILHRLRSISERIFFGRGVALRWTAALWFLGAAGLAGAPPFSTMLGEARTSAARKFAEFHSIRLLSLSGGVLTSAALLRVGMHTFFGLGDLLVTDRPC
jgi:formate hydrogenlyase subunit 3/multisubunit Na+/H+ antiporter MnhD subunit